MKVLLTIAFFAIIFLFIYGLFSVNMQCAESGGTIMRGAFGGFGCLY